MQRRLRVTLTAAGALAAAAGGIGTAGATGWDSVPTQHARTSHHSSVDCTAKFDKHQRPLTENDFPSYNSPRAEPNSTRNDARSSDGTPYYTHNATCDDTSHGHHGYRLRTDSHAFPESSYTNNASRGYAPGAYDYDDYGSTR